MKLYTYKSYKEYLQIQIATNKRKEKAIWCNEEYIREICDYLKTIGYENNLSIICHGTRNGAELEYFKKYINPKEIIGTEISDTATKYSNTIQWDFHNVKKEWLNHFDIIYSNALDHSYKPIECLDIWISCLNSKGVLIIEWSTGHFPEATKKTDPFGATFEELEKILHKYKTSKIIKNDSKSTRFYFIYKTKI